MAAQKRKKKKKFFPTGIAWIDYLQYTALSSVYYFFLLSPPDRPMPKFNYMQRAADVLLAIGEEADLQHDLSNTTEPRMVSCKIRDDHVRAAAMAFNHLSKNVAPAPKVDYSNRYVMVMFGKDMVVTSGSTKLPSIQQARNHCRDLYDSGMYDKVVLYRVTNNSRGDLHLDSTCTKVRPAGED